MDTILIILSLLGMWFILALTARPRSCHVNVECLPLKAYEILCNAGGSLAEDELVRRLARVIDPQRVRLFQTFTGKAREVVTDLLGTGCVSRGADGTFRIEKPMIFVNTSGEKRVEFSLKASGRGMDHRYF